MFTADRIAGLSAGKRALLEARLRGDRSEVRPSAIPRLWGRASAPLSYAQERLWFLDRLSPNDAAFTIPIALRLRGVLDRDAFVVAVGELIARHDVLRTRFVERDGV